MTARRSIGPQHGPFPPNQPPGSAASPGPRSDRSSLVQARATRTHTQIHTHTHTRTHRQSQPPHSQIVPADDVPEPSGNDLYPYTCTVHSADDLSPPSERKPWSLAPRPTSNARRPRLLPASMRRAGVNLTVQANLLSSHLLRDKRAGPTCVPNLQTCSTCRRSMHQRASCLVPSSPPGLLHLSSIHFLTCRFLSKHLTPSPPGLTLPSGALDDAGRTLGASPSPWAVS